MPQETSVKVIIVEDHTFFRSILKRMIERVNPCEVVAEATCGLEAVEKIRTVSADFIVLDLKLPGLSGLSVIREARKMSKAKILVLSIFTEEDVVRAALSAGANGFCSKNVRRSSLTRAIHEVLDDRNPVYL